MRLSTIAHSIRRRGPTVTSMSSASSGEEVPIFFGAAPSRKASAILGILEEMEDSNFSDLPISPLTPGPLDNPTFGITPEVRISSGEDDSDFETDSRRNSWSTFISSSPPSSCISLPDEPLPRTPSPSAALPVKPLPPIVEKLQIPKRFPLSSAQNTRSRSGSQSSARSLEDIPESAVTDRTWASASEDSLHTPFELFFPVPPRSIGAFPCMPPSPCINPQRHSEEWSPNPAFDDAIPDSDVIDWSFVEMQLGCAPEPEVKHRTADPQYGALVGRKSSNKWRDSMDDFSRMMYNSTGTKSSRQNSPARRPLRTPSPATL